MSNQISVREKLKTYLKHPGSLILMLLVMLAAVLTFIVLLFLIAYILINGVPHIKPSLFSLHYIFCCFCLCCVNFFYFNYFCCSGQLSRDSLWGNH